MFLFSCRAETSSWCPYSFGYSLNLKTGLAWSTLCFLEIMHDKILHYRFPILMLLTCRQSSFRKRLSAKYCSLFWESPWLHCIMFSIIIMAPPGTLLFSILTKSTFMGAGIPGLIFLITISKPLVSVYFFKSTALCISRWTRQRKCFLLVYLRSPFMYDQISQWTMFSHFFPQTNCLVSPRLFMLTFSTYCRSGSRWSAECYNIIVLILLIIRSYFRYFLH